MAKKKETKKVGAGLVFSWIFGILFLLSAIGSIFSGEIFSGMVLFVMAGAILPTVNKLLKEKQNIELSRGLKITIIIIGLIIIGITSGSSNIDSTNNYENNIQSENTKAPSSAELSKVFLETNTYRLLNLKDESTNINFESWNSSFFQEILDLTPIVFENCGEFLVADSYVYHDNGILLIIDAETYKIKCDYLNLVDKDTGLDVPQDEIDEFLTKRENEKSSLDKNSAEEPETTTSQTTTPAVEEQSDKATIGEKNALSKALSYLRYSAFSYSGLVEQLEYEGYTRQEAVYGVDNCGANWNEQAALKAQSYLDYSAFSREGLIEQLEYEGFTREQAEYGVQAVGY